jgi:hypothetical protein
MVDLAVEMDCERDDYDPVFADKRRRQAGGAIGYDRDWRHLPLTATIRIAASV